ncbi:MAG: alpha/beta hydrolase [Candidatus Thiodiazotropha sp. (ex Monitilora ramsayi)]|nr:alpha/beta hydrolase [Candidatus Thiodiazotropha sp. (ex Monitilora ramsayi)]
MNATANAPHSNLKWISGGVIKYVVINGINIRYLQVGEGPPLVLIHTIRTQLDYFRKIIPELAKHYCVYALDLPGHGYSDIVDRAHDKPLFVDVVTTFIKELGLKEVTLAGESIGGSIALGVATKQEVSIKRVIAMNAADYDNSNGLDRSSVLGRILFTGITWPVIGWVISNAETREVLKLILRGGFGHPDHLPKDLVTEFSRVGKRRGYSKAFRSIFLNWHSWTENRKLYRQINTPVVLVYGEHDWTTQSERTSNLESIKDSRLIEIEGAGHFSSLDSPEKITDIILNG